MDKGARPAMKAKGTRYRQPRALHGHRNLCVESRRPGRGATCNGDATFAQPQKPMVLPDAGVYFCQEGEPRRAIDLLPRLSNWIQGIRLIYLPRDRFGAPDARRRRCCDRVAFEVFERKTLFYPDLSLAGDGVRRAGEMPRRGCRGRGHVVRIPIEADEFDDQRSLLQRVRRVVRGQFLPAWRKAGLRSRPA